MQESAQIFFLLTHSRYRPDLCRLRGRAGRIGIELLEQCGVNPAEESINRYKYIKYPVRSAFSLVADLK